MNNMKMSNNGLELLKHFEGLRLEAYRDPAGVWTNGYGHTKDVHAGDRCTPQQALEWLLEDVEGSEYVVNKVVQVPLNQNQFDALVDFVYNLGSGNFQKSTLLKLLNAGEYAGAAKEFPRWNYAGGKVLPGLTARRNAERELFNTPIPIPQTQSSAPATLVDQLRSWVRALQGKFNSR